MTANLLHPEDEVRIITGWLDEIQYRPGWKLAVRCDGWFRVQLEVTGKVEDSRCSGQSILLTRTVPVWPELADDRELFLGWLRNELFAIERHESAEWLRWRTGPNAGLPIFDPHQDKL